MRQIKFCCDIVNFLKINYVWQANFSLFADGAGCKN